MVSAGNVAVLVVLALALFGGNNPVAVAAALVLLLNLLGLDKPVFPFLDKNGIQIGVVVLTAAILVPLASGRISYQEILGSLKQVRTLLAIVMGMLVTYFAGRGVGLLSEEPQLISAIIIGTIVGVAFLRGVSVGPLVGAGILALIFRLFRI
ncbi:hypothetical protein SY88_07350 [Clostridiales bacterium PH28_bin88]|nr:hypothetical protein SY88_07350 [Clostridiales bacterium PH28_bin88]